MPNTELFHPKAQEQLVNQTNYVSNILVESLIPPSARDNLYTESERDLKERFTARYAIYTDTLRSQRRGEHHSLINGQFAQRLRVLNSLDNYINQHYSNENGRILREDQITVFGALRDFLERGGTEGYIKLPTGSGKTVLFTVLAEATNIRTLIITPRQLLVDQTDEKFQEFTEGVEVGKIYSDKKEFDKQVTLTTYSSFVSRTQTGDIMPDDYVLLVLDEGHKALGEQTRGVVKLFDRAIKIGFTATPKYAENKELKDLLHNEIYSLSIREGVELGILSPFSVFLAQMDVDLSNIRVTSSGDYDDEDLERMLNIKSRNLAAVEVYKKIFAGQKTVTYCVTRKHAQDMAEIFNEQGVAADFVSGAQTRNEQENRLDMFKSGEIRILCNADLLIEGFDEPSATICFNLRPTLSPVVAEQRAGRVLRLDPNNPNKHATIVDFLGKDYTPGGSPGDNVPVSFAQVVDSAYIFRKTVVPYERKNEIGTSLYPEIEISGIKVTTNAEEIMRVVRGAIGITTEGWYSITALSRRFRLPEFNLHNLLESFREDYRDCFTKMLLGDQLREYISPELVTILQSYFNPEELRKGIQDRDFVLNKSSYKNVFVGDFEGRNMLGASILKNLIDSLRKKEPEKFKYRRNKNGIIVEVFTDRELFIREAEKAGMFLKGSGVSVRDNEFAISSPSIEATFVGQYAEGKKLKISLDECLDQLKQQYPDKFVKRKMGSHTVTVFTDKTLLIYLAEQSGIRVRSRDSLELVHTETDFQIGQYSFKKTFIGGWNERLKSLATQVERLAPEKFVKRKTIINQVVLVCTDPQFFIRSMLELGAQLRTPQEDEEKLEVQDGDFVLSKTSFQIVFVGDAGKKGRLGLIVDKAIDELRKNYPDLFMQRKHALKVFTDKELLFRTMLELGATLRKK